MFDWVRSYLNNHQIDVEIFTIQYLNFNLVVGMSLVQPCYITFRQWNWKTIPSAYSHTGNSRIQHTLFHLHVFQITEWSFSKVNLKSIYNLIGIAKYPNKANILQHSLKSESLVMKKMVCNWRSTHTHQRTST